MGRVMKSKRSKANAKATKDLEKDAVEESNGSVGSCDEESENELKNSVKTNKHGRKNEVSKSKVNNSEENTHIATKSRKGKKGRKSPENSEGSENEPDEDSEDSAPVSKKSKKTSGKFENNDHSDSAEEAVDEDYEVEKIVDSKMQGSKKLYLVRWKGFAEDKDTWEHEENLNCLELIKEYLTENPDAFEKSSKAKSKKKVGEATKSRKGKKGRKSQENSEGSEVEPDEDLEDSAPLRKKSKKASGKFENNDHSDSAEEAVDEDYEVEKIVDSKMQGSKKLYLVRWKGFAEDKDTWEHEENLNCLELIKEYLTENPDAFEKSSKAKSKKKIREEKKGKKTKNSASKKQEPVDENKDYEVEKVLEVHFRKNGEREFLIRWKGYSSSDDSWEPESNLNCPDLIEKFMQKVNKAKEASVRELRVAPEMTKRFTLNTREAGRRLSGRHQSKQRYV